MKKSILLFLLLIIVAGSACVQEQVQPPTTTQPATTQPPPILPPVTTTQPSATAQPLVTAAPTTTAPPTTAPPITTQPPLAKTLETYDVAVAEDSNLRIVITGKVRNNGNEPQFNVKVAATLYDEFGQVMKTEKSVPIDMLASGQIADFKITSDILRSKVVKYTLEAESGLTATPAPETKTTIYIRNFVFNPSTVTIKAGATIIWINEDSAPHRIKSDNFNSETLNKGVSFKFKFETKGTHDYVCGIHPSMRGRIVVE